MIDFHSHILPGIDDGADCVETSLEMLRKAKEQGVSQIVATPHFYPEQMTVDSFLEYRQAAYEALCDAMDGEEFPEIHLGCEVHLGGQTPEIEDLKKLCLEGTKVVLLEMPYGLLHPWMIDTVYQIIAKGKMIPVIAHVDRYHDMLKQFERLKTLLSMEVVVQLNADAFLSWGMNRHLKKIIGLNRPVVLGSDMHNLTTRTNRIEAASKKIEKKFGAQLLQSMEENAKKLLDNRLPSLF